MRDYGDFCWYDISFSKLIKKYRLVICDGPPAQTRGGRFGLIPLMKDKFGRGTIILLDDATREGENRIINDWKKIVPMKIKLSQTEYPFAKIELI